MFINLDNENSEHWISILHWVKSCFVNVHCIVWPKMVLEWKIDLWQPREFLDLEWMFMIYRFMSMFDLIQCFWFTEIAELLMVSWHVHIQWVFCPEKSSNNYICILCSMVSWFVKVFCIVSPMIRFYETQIYDN